MVATDIIFQNYLNNPSLSTDKSIISSSTAHKNEMLYTELDSRLSLKLSFLTIHFSWWISSNSPSSLRWNNVKMKVNRTASSSLQNEISGVRLSTFPSVCSKCRFCPTQNKIPRPLTDPLSVLSPEHFLTCDNPEISSNHVMC